MSKLNKIGYSLKDISIVPSKVSYISSRKSVNPYINVCNRETYPIFVAPMGAVTDENNYNIWIENKVTPVIPRTVSERLSISERLALADTTFVSFSLNEAREISYYEYTEGFGPKYICIDLANGHLNDLLDVCKRLKDCWGNKIVIMTGNIANPNTYKEYCKVGIDYVRVGIGGGSRCTTSANVGVHLPMATLIDEISYDKKQIITISGQKYLYGEKIKVQTKIIADGGIYNFDDINKALALGADAVMLGKVFAECEEACGEIRYAKNEVLFSNGISYSKETNDKLTEKLNPYREYYGMSTKHAQRETGGNGDKTAEGISKPVLVKYPVSKWIDNMQSYLRSAMSYCDANDIEEYKDNAQIIILGGSGDFTYRK